MYDYCYFMWEYTLENWELEQSFIILDMFANSMPSGSIGLIPFELQLAK